MNITHTHIYLYRRFDGAEHKRTKASQQRQPDAAIGKVFFSSYFGSFIPPFSFKIIQISHENHMLNINIYGIYQYCWHNDNIEYNNHNDIDGIVALS